MALTQTQVSQLYVTLFGRVSEGAGNKYWQSAVSDVAAGADAMLATSAAQEYFGSALTSNEAFIKHIYKNTLNKSEVEDPAGIKFWVDALKAGNSRGLVVSELIKAAQDPANKGAAQDYFNNKVALSDYTATKVEGKDLKVKDLAPFKEALTKVTSDASSLTDAKAFVDSLANIAPDNTSDWNSNPVNPGTTVELTYETDKATANVFNAPMGYNGAKSDRVFTLNSEDVLTGDPTRSDNTLNATFGNHNGNEADPTSRTPELKNVQNINIQVTGDINTLDLRNADDVEKINIDKVTQEASNTFTVQSIGQKLDGMRLADVAKKDINVKFEHKKGVAGGFEDKSSLYLEKVKAASLEITSDEGNEGYESLNLVSKQGVSLDSFDANQLRELTIKGSGSLKVAKVNINDGANPQFDKVEDGGISNTGTRGFTKLDASGYTGTLTLDITNLVKGAKDPFDSGRELDTDIIGTKLGDTFYLRNGLAKNKVSIDGGEGEDKLVLVKGGIAEGDTRVDGKTAMISNVETLEMRAQGSDLSVDFDRFDANLKKVLVRTERPDTPTTFTLADISAQFAKEGEITIAHAAGEKDKTNNYDTIVVAKLKDASGKDDSLTFKTIDANNRDTTFEYKIDAEGVENITIADNDTESNEVDLVKASDHIKTLTLTGGTKDLYFAVKNDVISKTVDASGQISDLKLTVADQEKDPGQTIKLGSGNDVLTFKAIDSLDSKDTISDVDGKDTVRAIFSKDNALNLKGIESVHVAASKDINLDVSKTDISKLVLMSREAVQQTDVVKSLGYGVYGMGNTTDFADTNDISTKSITLKSSNISELDFAGDLDAKNDFDATGNPIEAADDKTAQVFNGVTLENNTSKDLDVKVRSSLDRIKKDGGAVSYTIGQITAHGVENFNVKVSDEKDENTTTTIKDVWGTSIKNVTVEAKGNVNLNTVTGNSLFNSIANVDASKVGGDFTAHVQSLGDSAKVKLGDGNNDFSAIGSSGNKIEIKAGKGNDKIEGSSGSDIIEAGEGDNEIKADRGDNRVVVGSGNDKVEAKDGNNTVDLGKGFDTYKGNIGTGLNTTKMITSITKMEGRAVVDFATDGGAAATTSQVIAADANDTLNLVWEGDQLKSYTINGRQALTAGTDGDDDILVGAEYQGKTTILTAINNASSTISGGKGNDTITVTQKQTSALKLEGGDGNDIFAIQSDGSATAKITAAGGKDADTYYINNWTGTAAHVIEIKNGDSVLGSHDVVYGFKSGTNKLDLEQTVTKTTANTDDNKVYNGVDVGVVKAHHAAANGVVTFFKADTTTNGGAAGAEGKEGVATENATADAAGLSSKLDAGKYGDASNALMINKNNLADAVNYLSKYLEGTTKTVYFAYDKNGDGVLDQNDSVMLFQKGSAQDTLVELAGVYNAPVTTGTVLSGIADGDVE